VDADLSQYEADATESVSGEDLLQRITITCRDLKTAREDVTAAEEVLKAAQGRVRQLEEFTLPELMREAGQEMLRTMDGETVELKETLHASIPVANLQQALKWLEEHGQGAIIKRDIRLQFGKGEDAKADSALRLILEAGLTPQDKQSVHPQTLAAVLRELIAAGEEVPLELLGAHVRTLAKVTPPKAKK
jgi:hypothetical protein